MPAARSPKLLPQAILLLLPVVVLAVVGAVSLARERAAAFQEALETMGDAAAKIALKLGSDGVLLNYLPADAVPALTDADGALVSPRPYPSVPPSNSGRRDLSSAGLPLAVLEAISAGDASAAAKAALDHPSIITLRVLEEYDPSEIPEWELRENARVTYSKHPFGRFQAWVAETLHFRIPEDSGLFRIASITESELADAIDQLGISDLIPPFADAVITLEGRSITGADLGGDTISVSQTWLPGKTGSLVVDLAITRPEIISARFRNRALWLGGIIAAAALAALLGFLSTRRAFLQQQQLAAEKDNFVSSVSHELRAPVASMQIMAESLATDRVTSPENRHEYYRLITDECRRLGSLVENVLDFSRLESGRKTFAFEDTDLEALVTATTKLMAPQATKKEVIIKTDLTPATANIDSAAIQRALINLLENAITHTPRGTTITAGAAPGKLWVEDQGPGIPEAERTKIFERFYRSGSELTRETKGVGIGLSIVKSIAEAHGGSVSVRGSRFTIILP